MPDLNSVPASPRVLATSRRTSSSIPATQSLQASPPTTASQTPALNILPSNQQTLSQSQAGSLPSPPLNMGSSGPTATATMAPGQDNTGVGAGPGPLRHPRPLTAAELHSQLEHEQELLVNRLTRDLSMLRAAQNSSVVSNTSSTSASTDQGQHLSSSFTDTHLLSGPGLPPSTSADRRHTRTSSSTSARSLSQIASLTSNPPHPHSGNAASVLEAARNPRGAATSMSRQNSTASHRSRSRNHSPQPYSLSSSHTQSHAFPHGDPSYFPRGGSGHPPSNPSTTAATPGSELSPGLMPATLRYEETAHYRQELDIAKRENEVLKKRIRELERLVRDRRESDAAAPSSSSVSAGARPRSESVSTTTSMSVSGATGVGSVVGGGTGIAGGRRAAERMPSSTSVAGSVGVGVPEDEVRVGESAASAGLRAAAATIPEGGGGGNAGEAGA